MVENRGSGHIAAATIVVPSLDEAENVLPLRDSIREQRKNLSQSVSLRWVIADNGSKRDTLNVYEQLMADEEVQPEDERLDICVLHGSEKGYNGSARAQGVKNAVEVFHYIHPEKEPDEHVVINFDADTRFGREDTLQVLTGDVLSDPNTQVAYGPIKFVSSTGKVSSDYSFFQRPYTRVLLDHLFRLNGRKAAEYLNPPGEIIHTIFFPIRESAIVDRQDPGKLAVNFNPKDRAGVDLRMSLMLQNRLEQGQVVFDPRLAVLTSARGYETSDGNISRFEFARKAIELFVGTRYTPYALGRDLENLPENQRKAIEKNLRFADVVGSFIEGVDRRVYGLEEGERVTKTAVGDRKARQYFDNGAAVMQARNLKTGELLPDKYAIIDCTELQRS